MTYTIGSSEDLLRLLNDLEKQPSISIIEIQNLSVLFNLQMKALTQVYLGAEGNIFNQKITEPDGVLYSKYFSERVSVTTAEADLFNNMVILQKVVDEQKKSLVNTEQSTLVTKLDREAAERQVSFNTSIAQIASEVARAAGNVTEAKLALGEVKAPFDGVVTKRFKDVGEYVLPGQPLLQLEGVNGLELVTNISAKFRSLLSVGQPFIANGEIVGVVDRFSPFGNGNNATVVISLFSDNFSSGETAVGEINLIGDDKIFVIPKSYAFFDNNGVFIRDEFDSYPINILYDNGKALYISTNTYTDEKLIPARSINLW